jgi:hypothetical protein
MPKNNRGGEWFTGNLPGIFQSLMAATLGGGLLLATDFAWQRYFHHPLPSPLDGTLANGLAACILVPAFWLASKPLSLVAAHRFLGKTPEVKGDRLSIYVAHFGDDELSATARDRVIASIRSELGPERVEVLPAGIRLTLTQGVSDELASNDATAKARALLKEKNGDLLIWGVVIPRPGMMPLIDLRFVSAESDRPTAEPLAFTNKWMLDVDFGPEIGPL